MNNIELLNYLNESYLKCLNFKEIVLKSDLKCFNFEEIVLKTVFVCQLVFSPSTMECKGCNKQLLDAGALMTFQQNEKAIHLALKPEFQIGDKIKTLKFVKGEYLNWKTFYQVMWKRNRLTLKFLTKRRSEKWQIIDESSELKTLEK